VRKLLQLLLYKVEKREEGRGMGMTIGYSNKRDGKEMRGRRENKIAMDYKKK
jgi:hypothetical protein